MSREAGRALQASGVCCDSQGVGQGTARGFVPPKWIRFRPRLSREALDPGVKATIVNVGYRSTNYWVVSTGASRLLVDLGWPGTMGMMRANLRRMDVPLSEIRFGLATHYHIDHAGLAQELKLAGIALLVLETQVDALPRLKAHTKPGDGFVEISTHDNLVLPFSQSRALLAGVGLEGEILPTSGHSDDSVSLLLDDGSGFTGDLNPVVGWEGEEAVAASWRLLGEHGLSRIYPGHGPVRPGPA